MSIEYTEIIEALDNLEDSLVNYSSMITSESIDASLIHTMFRVAHNLKSSLAMINKIPCSKLIHSVENAFDDIRNGKIAMSQGLIDLSLSAVDLILKNLEGNRNDEQIYILGESITAFLEQAHFIRSKKPVPLNIPLDKVQKKLLVEKLEENKNIFLVEKMIKSDIKKDIYNNLPIFADIDENGTLIAKTPDFSEIDTSKDEFLLQLLFSSSKSKDDFFFIIFDPLKQLDLQKEDFETSDSDNESSTGKKSKLNILIVEDNFVARHLAQSVMYLYGSSDVAINGTEAVFAFKNAWENDTPYDVILLDIKLPEADGHTVLQKIRDFEEKHNIEGLDRAKVIILSGISDLENIMQTFREQADAYIIKPLTEEKINKELSKFEII